MSQSEYHDWLFEVGTGWLGWTEEQTLHTTMRGIEAALKGRMSMLKAIFGDGSKDTPTVSKTPMTGSMFRAMFSKGK